MQTQTTTSIRAARQTDLADILAMIRELASFENLEEELQVTAFSLQEALFGAQPSAWALVAAAGSETVGYAIYYKTFSSFTGGKGLFLDDIYVRPKWRKQGVGRQLLERVAQIGIQLDCKRFEWIALRWNQNALDFYQSVGSKMLDDWTLLRMEQPGMKALANRKLESLRK
jgi:GNAT superfamily N-acetyltransferase